MLFESFGGVEGEAEEVLKSLSRLVADNTRTPYGEVAQRLWQRISVGGSPGLCPEGRGGEEWVFIC